MTEYEKKTLRKSKTLDRPLRFNALFVLVLVLDSIQYSNPTYWSASYREPPRSTIGIAAVRTAIEYRCTEYRCTEYRCTEYRFAEYEYDEIRRDAQPILSTRRADGTSRVEIPRFFSRGYRVTKRFLCVAGPISQE
ncbi:MAG: hypothetical protein DWI26_08155 [Planctomycetota bacterium]|nr:MAG: hypothetical protein DWI26_08155 [Planctomycetota bacterium]